MKEEGRIEIKETVAASCQLRNTMHLHIAPSTTLSIKVSAYGDNPSLTVICILTKMIHPQTLEGKLKSGDKSGLNCIQLAGTDRNLNPKFIKVLSDPVKSGESRKLVLDIGHLLYPNNYKGNNLYGVSKFTGGELELKGVALVQTQGSESNSVVVLSDMKVSTFGSSINADDNKNQSELKRVAIIQTQGSESNSMAILSDMKVLTDKYHKRQRKLQSQAAVEKLGQLQPGWNATYYQWFGQTLCQTYGPGKQK